MKITNTSKVSVSFNTKKGDERSVETIKPGETANISIKADDAYLQAKIHSGAVRVEGADATKVSAAAEPAKAATSNGKPAE